LDFHRLHPGGFRGVSSCFRRQFSAPLVTRYA
jgi:hypothetical protein